MEREIVILKTTRSDYQAESAASCTLTVGDLISVLNQFDEKSPVIYCNDNGYTYGYIYENMVKSINE